MKICRYVMREASTPDAASPRYGLIEGENVIEISGPPWGTVVPRRRVLRALPRRGCLHRWILQKIVLHWA